MATSPLLVADDTTSTKGGLISEATILELIREMNHTPIFIVQFVTECWETIALMRAGIEMKVATPGADMVIDDLFVCLSRIGVNPQLTLAEVDARRDRIKELIRKGLIN